MEQLENTYLKKLFDPYFEAPLSSWEKVASRATKRTFNKNEIIKEEGKTEKYINLIIEGSVGVFLWSDNNTKCLDLFYDHDYACDYMSFINNEPSQLFTQALEKTIMFSMSHAEATALSESSEIGLQIYSSAAKSLFVHKQKQQIELLTLSAEERYKIIIQEKPEIIQRTSAKHIASYLGIAPESMSRIRNKIAPGS